MNNQYKLYIFTFRPWICLKVTKWHWILKKQNKLSFILIIYLNIIYYNNSFNLKSVCLIWIKQILPKRTAIIKMVLFEIAQIFHFNLIVNDKIDFITRKVDIFHKPYLILSLSQSEVDILVSKKVWLLWTLHDSPICELGI